MDKIEAFSLDNYLSDWTRQRDCVTIVGSLYEDGDYYVIERDPQDKSELLRVHQSDVAHKQFLNTVNQNGKDYHLYSIFINRDAPVWHMHLTECSTLDQPKQVAANLAPTRTSLNPGSRLGHRYPRSIPPERQYGGFTSWPLWTRYKASAAWGANNEYNEYSCALDTFFSDGNKAEVIAIKRTTGYVTTSQPQTIQDFGATSSFLMTAPDKPWINLPPIRAMFTNAATMFSYPGGINGPIAAAYPTLTLPDSPGDFPYVEMVFCNRGPVIHTTISQDDSGIDVGLADSDPTNFIQRVFQYTEKHTIQPGYQYGYPDFVTAIDLRPGIGWVMGVNLFRKDAVDIRFPAIL